MKKGVKKNKEYNTTELDPESCFERHVFHRDFVAHWIRWSFVLKEIGPAQKNETVVDFGCGHGNLAEVLYRNRRPVDYYVGLDIREKVIEENKKKFEKQEWIEFFAVDLVDTEENWKELQADRVVSFEVIEHVNKKNGDKFLQNFLACGKENAIYYLSTPNYDPKVGAADNHTYDGQVQEYDHKELQALLEKYFYVERKWGTFASIRDYEALMNDWQKQMFENLRGYYDTNLLSVIMAPFFPEQSRNCLWVLRRKK